MKNKILYSSGIFTIELANEEYRTEYFEAFEDDFVFRKDHTIDYINERRSLKVSIRKLYTDYKDISYIIRMNDKVIGFFIVEPPTVIAPATGRKIHIIRKYRKTKALACAIDYAMNFLYPNENIQVDQKFTPGLDKLLVKLKTDIVNVGAFTPDTKKRVRNICKEK